jgi:hypothetical protein
MEDWREKAAAGDAGRFAPMAEFSAQVRQLDAGDPFSQEWIISTGEQDRHGDVIEPAGWDFTDYLRGGPGVVLYAHQRGDWEVVLPVAKCPSVKIIGDGVVAIATFPRPEEAGFAADAPYFANSVRLMAAAGFLKNASVGFMPMEWTYDEELDGYRFLKNSLLEWSVVPVPANAGAYHLAKQFAAAHPEHAAPLIEWAQRTLDALHGEGGLFLTRERLDKLLRASGWEPGKAFTLPAAAKLKAVEGMEKLSLLVAPMLASVAAAEPEPEPAPDPGPEPTAAPDALTAALAAAGLTTEDVVAAALAAKTASAPADPELAAADGADDDPSTDLILFVDDPVADDTFTLDLDPEAVKAAVRDGVAAALNTRTAQTGKVY